MTIRALNVLITAIKYWYTNYVGFIAGSIKDEVSFPYQSLKSYCERVNVKIETSLMYASFLEFQTYTKNGFATTINSIIILVVKNNL